MKNTDEILDKLAEHIANISYRTYYRKRRVAIESLSTILWGFTAKETLDTLNKFFPNYVFLFHQPISYTYSIHSIISFPIKLPYASISNADILQCVTC